MIILEIFLPSPVYWEDLEPEEWQAIVEELLQGYSSTQYTQHTELLHPLHPELHRTVFTPGIANVYYNYDSRGSSWLHYIYYWPKQHTNTIKHIYIYIYT